MALRDVLIKLRLDTSQYKTAIAAASANTKAFAKDTTAATTKAGKSLGLLPGSYATIGLAAGAAAVASVRAAADFEQSMANVRATGAASASQMNDLSDAALEMGKTTVYSSTEAAGGMEALLKAGLSAADVMSGGLKGSFDLAASGGLEVAEAAETAASAMAQFSLAGADVPHIADLLAAGAGKANGDVRDLGQALNQAGLVAAGAGASIEETTGTLAAFAKAGLLGSDAGTSFKTMLQRLQNPADEAKGLMKDLGISAYDANGQFVGLAAIAGQLRQAFKDSSDETRNQALATIFGADAVRAANVLYKEGQDGIAGWTAKVNDAGYAADVAAAKTDTLKGDLDKMKNSWRALAEGGGAGGGGGLRPMVQGLDELADAIGTTSSKWDKFTTKILGSQKNDNPFEIIRELLNRDKAFSLGVKDIYIKFKTQGTQGAINDAARVAVALDKTPEQVTTALELKDWDQAGIDAVIAKMNELDGKKADALFDLIGNTEALAEMGLLDTELDNLNSKNPRPKVNLDGVPKALRDILEVGGGLEEIDKSDPEATITVDNDEAIDAINDVMAKIRAMTSLEGFLIFSQGLAGGGAIEYAHGGHARGAIRGAGGPTQDSIPARLSNGEHVLTASDVRKMGGQEAVYEMRRAVQAGALRFAAGGEPSRSYAASSGGYSGPSSFTTNVGISILDVAFNPNGMLTSMRVVARDEANQVLAEQVFEAAIA